MNDFTSITELPGTLLNQEQLARITQRYRLGAELAQGKDVLEVSCGAGVGLGMLRQTSGLWPTRPLTTRTGVPPDC